MAIIREFSAGGIVIKRFKDGFKVLLIKNGYGRWTWPKGNIERGETSKEAALREIKEEVGLKDLRAIERIEEVKYFYKLKGRLIFKTVILFLIESKSKERIKPLLSEIQETKWFDFEEALNRVEYRGASKILQKAIDMYREHLRL